MVDSEGNKNQDALPVADSLKSLSTYIKKSENFFNAAYLIHIKNNSEILSALASSQDLNLQALAAASLSIRAHSFYYESLIERNDINISENVEEVPKVQGKGKSKKSKKTKGKNSTKAKVANSDIDSDMLSKFLMSKNSKAQLYALQAASYAADKSLEETINALSLKSPELISLKFLYRVRIGQGVNSSELKKITPIIMKKKSPKPQSYVSFSLDTPALSYLCQALGEAKLEEGLNILHSSLNNPDLRIRVDAARAIKNIKSTKSMATVSKNLASAPWPVLIELCHYCARVPHKGMLPGLIQRLSKEKGRVRVNLNYAISAIAGAQHESVPEKWAEWYKK